MNQVGKGQQQLLFLKKKAPVSGDFAINILEQETSRNYCKCPNVIYQVVEPIILLFQLP